MNFVKFNSTLQQAGKNWGSLRGKIFARLLTAPKSRQGWKAAPLSCSVKRSKTKHFSIPFRRKRVARQN